VAVKVVDRYGTGGHVPPISGPHYLRSQVKPSRLYCSRRNCGFNPTYCSCVYRAFNRKAVMVKIRCIFQQIILAVGIYFTKTHISLHYWQRSKSFWDSPHQGCATGPCCMGTCVRDK